MPFLKQRFRQCLDKLMKQLLIAILLISIFGCAAADNAISLDGQWRFQLDRADAGIAGRWFEHALTDKIKLPGSLTAQGVGDDITADTPWVGGVKRSEERRVGKEGRSA